METRGWYTHCRYLNNVHDRPSLCWTRPGWLRSDATATAALGVVPYLGATREIVDASAVDFCRHIDYTPVCWSRDEVMPGFDSNPAEIEPHPIDGGGRPQYCRPIEEDTICWRPYSFAHPWSGVWRPAEVPSTLCRFIGAHAVCWTDGAALPTHDDRPGDVFTGLVGHDGSLCRMFNGHRICWDEPDESVVSGNYAFVLNTPPPTPTPEPIPTPSLVPDPDPYFTPWERDGLQPLDKLPISFCSMSLLGEEGDAVHDVLRAESAVAATAWNDALGFEAIQYDGDCPEIVPDWADRTRNDRSEIVLENVPIYATANRQPYGNWTTDISISTRASDLPGCTWQTIAHEMGHALGLGHGSQEGAIMYFVQQRDIDTDGSESCRPEAIQPWEVRQMLDAWGIE